MLLLAFAVALPLPSLGGSSVAVAAIQRAKSLIELMHQRSPGKRTIAHLALTKHKKVALRERARPKMRKRPPALAAVMPPFPAELPPALVDLVAPPLPVQFASLEAVPVGPFAESPLFPYPLSPPGTYILPPPQTPAGTEGGGGPPVVVPPTPSVPEPQTWAMMLVGMGILGWSLRRRREREQIAA